MSISDRAERHVDKLGLEITGEQWSSLEAYASLVVAWNRKINLVRYRNLEELWVRHILESLILIPYLRETTIVDLGAGAGFLSVPLAICQDRASVVCLENKQKRVVFLSKVKRDLGLPYRIIRDRLERWLPEEDLTRTLLIARALPKWGDVLPPLLARSCPGSRLALFVGQEWEKGAEEFLPFWDVEQVLPIPEKAVSKVVFLQNVSRET